MEYLDLAKKAALSAGDVLLNYLGRIDTYELKSQKNLLTEADTASEKLIKSVVKDSFPSHDILAEESGLEENDSDYLWLIDPLDGTTNFAHAYPFFSVSIGLKVKGELAIGVVYDPVKKELFSAEADRGAYLNDKKITVSNVDDLEYAHLVTGFVHSHDWMIEQNLRHFCNFIHSAQAVRRDGSAALDLCYVACGRFDGFWELGLNPWDTAAGVLIVREAGGKVTNFSGQNFQLESADMLSSNSRLHNKMMDVLKE